MKKNVIVVGAGASGLFAAGQAAQSGAKVTLLEKTGSAGNKLLISGKGRCNITNNTGNIHDFIGQYNRAGRFLHQPFSHFFVTQLMSFFTEKNLALITERGGRVFPASGKAGDVVNTLLSWLHLNNVEVRYTAAVSEILVSGARVTGVRCGDRKIEGEAVILATGGASYPATGSSGDGYNLARQCGHTIIPLRPALVPLVVSHPDIKKLYRLDLRNVGFRAYINGKKKISDFGEVGFGRSTLGGPVTLTHSLFVGDCLQAGKQVTISLDLKPALDEQKLDSRLLRDFRKRKSEPLRSVLRGLLPAQLVETALRLCAVDGEVAAGQINAEERRRLRLWLKDFRLSIGGCRPLNEAIITAGGVNLKEIEPQTMESKITGGLFFSGEILDINGNTGGYNLQAAFSTGWLAGQNAAR